MALSVARGMAHIHYENILHCDLAARNLLVDMKVGEINLKINDFGLSGSTTALGDLQRNPLFLKPILLVLTRGQIMKSKFCSKKTNNFQSDGVLLKFLPLVTSAKPVMFGLMALSSTKFVVEQLPTKD